MRAWTVGLATIVVVMRVALAPVAAADKPQDLIVGKWQLKDAGGGGVTVEFGKDGKVKILIKKGANETAGSGTYKFVTDDSMDVVLTIDGEKKNERLKVKVTKDELVTVDEQKTEEKFSRVK